MILFCAVVAAQSRHEFLFDCGSGISSLNYSTTIGNQKIGFGWQGGVTYKLFYSDKISFGSGIQFMQFRSIFDMSNLYFSYMTQDRDNDNFEFRSRVTNYQEQQRLLQLQIPLMIQYQIGNIRMFYSAGGIKMGVPLLGKYLNSGGNIINSGYYSEENYEYTMQRFMGFGTFDISENSGSLNFKIAYSLSLEAGIKLNRGSLPDKYRADRLAIYAGAYFDYVLNNIFKSNNEMAHSQPRFVEYEPNMYDYKINSISLSNNENQLISPKMHPFAIGIKLKVAFGVGTSLARGEYPFFRRLPLYR